MCYETQSNFEYKFVKYFIHAAITKYFLFVSKWDDDLSLVAATSLFLVLVIVISWLFLICEPGAETTTKFEMFGTAIDQFD